VSKKFTAAVHIFNHGNDHYNLLMYFDDKEDFLKQVSDRLYGQLEALCEIWVTMGDEFHEYTRELIDYVYSEIHLINLKRG
jgi:hypothetical protein